jgi:hypothetical protein
VAAASPSEVIPVTEHDCFIHFDEHLLDHRLWQPILMKRYPNADPNATVADVVDPTEMVEIIREAEMKTEAFHEVKDRQGARELYRRLVTAAEPPTMKQ